MTLTSNLSKLHSHAIIADTLRYYITGEMYLDQSFGRCKVSGSFTNQSKTHKTSVSAAVGPYKSVKLIPPLDTVLTLSLTTCCWHSQVSSWCQETNSAQILPLHLVQKQNFPFSLKNLSVYSVTPASNAAETQMIFFFFLCVLGVLVRSLWLRLYIHLF